jgi:hypothetical protein
MKEYVELASYFLELPKPFWACFLVLSFAFIKMRGYIEKKYRMRRETLDEIRDFFLLDPVPNNKFLLEQFFFNHYGVMLSSKEIDFFLSKEKASTSLKLYLSGRQYIEVGKEDEVTIKKSYMSLRGKKWAWLAVYFFFGFWGMVFLLTAPSVLSASGLEAYVVWAVVVVAFIILAGASMDSANNASSAIKVIEMVSGDEKDEKNNMSSVGDKSEIEII